MEIRKLNLLRGLAALIVLVSHYSNVSGIWGSSLGRGAGQIGVMVFFILSGFLMSYLYADREFTRSQIRKYLVYRFARVVPLFLFVVFFSYLMHRAGLGQFVYNIWNLESLLSHLLLLKGASILWTIPTELQFYFLFLLFWWVYKISSTAFWIICCLIAGTVILLELPAWKGTFYFLKYDLRLPRSLPYFLAGLAFGLLYKTEFRKKLSQSGWFILSLGIIPLMFPILHEGIFGQKHGMWTDFSVFSSICLAFFFYVFLTPDNNKLISNPAGDFLGRVSYSLYLFHPIVFALIAPYAMINLELMLFVTIFVCLLVATVSYYLIEAPARSYFRKRFPASS